MPEVLNHVQLRGRLSGEPLELQLPSGDALVSFRIVVPRGVSPHRDKDRRTPTIDTIDCVAKTAAMRRKVLATKGDSELELTGALRRRFYRGASGLGSRYEVEVVSLTRCPAA